jgi:flavorubredoxin
MKALVVYESMWGNTRRVAEAVAAGLGDARVAEVADVTPAQLAGVELLVVGGPTHAFTMSRAATRQDARKQGAPSGDEHGGLREWIDGLPEELTTPVATFDTRATAVRHLPGSAAKAAERELERHHDGRVVDRRSFYVRGSDGPLADGELERAREWGEHLAARQLPVQK